MALLLRRVPVGDADLMVTLLTDRLGVLNVVARSARRTSKRFVSLEPMHRLRVELDVQKTTDRITLAGAAIDRPRLVLTGDLDKLEAAGRALRWVRRAASPGQVDTAVWEVMDGLLETLDERDDEVTAVAHLAAAGLRLTRVMGWAIELELCVRCGRACPPNRAAQIDPVQGGLVCRACGGAEFTLSAETRDRLRSVQGGASPEALEGPEVRLALELLDSVLAAHAGISRS